MSFAPVVPQSGYAGWAFLNRTLDAQKQRFAASEEIRRETSYFSEKIGSVRTADDLVADRRLLAVALGAFGLQEDLGNRFFIRKVLSDGTLDTKDLANRLSDKRYLELSRSFGFGDYATASTQISGFATEITSAYVDHAFEVAIGESDDAMRLGLNARRELAALATKDSSENTKWFSILGSPPLRSVVETAFGLPASFGAIDIDRQLGEVKRRAEQFLGSDRVSDFSEPEHVEKLLRLFMLKTDLAEGSGGLSAGGAALLLLNPGISTAPTPLDILAR